MVARLTGEGSGLRMVDVIVPEFSEVGGLTGTIVVGRDG
jgi:hypothetical protein